MMALNVGRDGLGDAASAPGTMQAEVLAGLRATPRTLPNRYLWDERGSALFERICEEANYHPAHHEIPLLKIAAPQVAGHVGAGCTILEFGCGGATRKVQVLLEALPDVRTYVGLDISEAFMATALDDLRLHWPGVEVLAVTADYSRSIPTLSLDRDRPVLGFFPGSSICNMAPRDAGRLLARLHEVIAPGWLLIGCDPPTPAAHLTAVYDSPAMHAFHENILCRLRDECGAGIEDGAFRHRGKVREEPIRVEASLVAQRPTQMVVAGEVFRFDQGEEVVTDWSYKYAAEDFRTLARSSGWHAAATWQDPAGRFNLYLLRT